MRIILTLTATAILAACSHGPHEIAVTPPPVVATVPAARPLPPAGAAATLVIPARLADGGFDTPNRAPSPAAAVWHLRAALNVAALRCNDERLLADYNAMLRVHRADFAAAHARLQVERGADFDGAMTRLYNYFALPGVQANFCAAASTIAAEMAAEPADFARYAPYALGVLDAPFTDFFARYADYRRDLAAWQAAQAPTLGYDVAVLASEGPPPRFAAVTAVAAR